MGDTLKKLYNIANKQQMIIKKIAGLRDKGMLYIEMAFNNAGIYPPDFKLENGIYRSTDNGPKVSIDLESKKFDIDGRGYKFLEELVVAYSKAAKRGRYSYTINIPYEDEYGNISFTEERVETDEEADIVKYFENFPGYREYYIKVTENSTGRGISITVHRDMYEYSIGDGVRRYGKGEIAEMARDITKRCSRILEE